LSELENGPPNDGGNGGAPSDIRPVSITEEMKKSYLDYAMSVIVARALPDARDGLKPVHRRILYAMHENGFEWNKPYRKSARTVGDVIGKYHPHGDQSVYDALVRMAQDFSMRVPLIDGQGNFGSVDGDTAAAMRYTESRLTKIAQYLLDDIDKDTVDFQPNYDSSEKEPSVLPAKFPNLLVNGSGGIAVGMATNIPPHNLGEVIDACTALIDNPGLSIDERRDVHQLLLAIPRNVTIVMIEHNMDVALEFAERITLLHFGEVIVEGSRAEVVADPRTREVYLGH